MPNSEQFPTLLLRLKQLLVPYASHLRVTDDGPSGYSLNTPFAEQYSKELFFGAVQINKNYVSYHLMPVYMFPDLLVDLSPRLKQRMQGKSCFNFTRLDDDLAAELGELTERSFARLHQEQLVK